MEDTVWCNDRRVVDESAGSAMEEFEKRTSSVEYHLAQLNAAWQELATNTASGELAVQMINANKFSYVVSTLQNNRKDDEDAIIRRTALMKRTPVFTSVHSAYTFSKSLANNNVMEELEVTDI